MIAERDGLEVIRIGPKAAFKQATSLGQPTAIQIVR